jgi:DNA-binding beta-propeller fold protein YncE
MTGILLRVALVTAVAMPASRFAAAGQDNTSPTNDLPNPYRTITGPFRLPEGRTWGATSAIDMAPDGQSIWIAERCGANTCLDRASGAMSDLPTVLRFDLSGNLMASFGQGLLIFPHGLHVDREGNVWVTDGQDNAPATGAGGPPPMPGAGPQPPRPNPAATRGHQVFKFSPDGRLLMTLGTAGGRAAPDYFFQPNDVITNARGEIFVSEGHSSVPGASSRILKFSPDGALVKVIGRRGSGPGEFDQPHALAFDSSGRLFVGDRGNNRVHVIDQEGNFVAAWPQFSRPSGLFIDAQDTLYVADSESGTVNPAHGAWRRGIRVGSARDGRVAALIPDPNEKATGTSAAEGVAVDRQGNIYGAEVGPRGVKKYVRE